MRWWLSRSAQIEETADDRFLGTRFFILAPGMVPVPRTSPIRARKRTPWHPKPDDVQLIDRAGGRDWFGAHLTLETQRQHKPATYGLAGIVHAGLSMGFVAIVLLRQDASTPQIHQPFMVPVLLSLPSASKLFPPKPAQPTTSQSAVAPAALPLAAAPAEVDEPVAPAPVQAPQGITPEKETGPPGVPEGAESGTPGGVVGGVAGGQPDGTAEVAKGPTAGAVRFGPGIEPPKKIKDVKPVYPQGSLGGRLRGTVVIEATIGTDGKVYEARVLRSIAGLDQAALDAVRQWEFAPARLDGNPVAVIMTVTVTFAIM